MADFARWVADLQGMDGRRLIMAAQSERSHFEAFYRRAAYFPEVVTHREVLIAVARHGHRYQYLCKQLGVPSED